MISEGAADRILAVIDAAVAQRVPANCSPAASASAASSHRAFYIEPTVFGNVDNSSDLAQTETFGPVVSLIRFQR